jgi:Co/Zn/Cd efflux system component
VLLDRQASQRVLDDIRSAIEQIPDTQVVDLRVWSIGTSKRAAIIAIEAGSPLEPNDYRTTIPSEHDLVHVTIEFGRASPTTVDSC